VQQLKRCDNGNSVWSGTIPLVNRCIGEYKSIDTDLNQGVFIPGIFRVNAVTIKQATGSISNGRAKFGCGTSIYQDNVSGPFAALAAGTWFGSFDSELHNYSLQKAFAKTRDVGWELGVFLGEFRDTVELLRNPLASLGKLVKSFARQSGKLAKGQPTSSAAAGRDLWMQIRYGLRPLIADIQNILELIDTYERRNRLNLKRKRARHTKETSVFDSQVGQVTGGNQGLSFNLERTTKTSITSTSVIYYRLKIFERTLQDALGMELDDIPNIIWELTRLSFVVDWFLSVGNWLRSITPNPRILVLGNCTSQKIDISVKVTTSKPWCVGGVAEFTSSDFTWTSQTLIRVTGSAMPALPAFNPSALGLMRSLDSIALIWQQIESNLRRR
jgi:hypothetical protein